MKVHDLKTWPKEFNAIFNHEKTAEYRLNDRDFKQGDALLLREYDPGKAKYSGGTVIARVTNIVYGLAFGIPEDYVVMSIQVMR